MQPLLTAVADFAGLVGGLFVAAFAVRIDPAQYWTRALDALTTGDILQGLTKPFIFGFIVALVGCYYGLRVRGGTAGVGRATTQAVVTASVLILVSNLFITRILLFLIDMMGW
jgi:phospholipid/cholesterol/gamma-HCH transport system permease protein